MTYGCYEAVGCGRVVVSAMTYETETWGVNRDERHCLDVMKKQMFTEYVPCDHNGWWRSEEVERRAGVRKKHGL